MRRNQVNKDRENDSFKVSLVFSVGYCKVNILRRNVGAPK